MSEQVQILLKNKNGDYPIPPTSLSTSVSISRDKLSQTILALFGEHNVSPQPLLEFDFLINERLLDSSLQDLIESSGISTEQQITVEYFERKPPPSKPHILPHPDWVSSVRIADSLVLSGSYDGTARAWDLSTYSLLSEHACHKEPVSSVLWLPQSDGTNLVATASHDGSVRFWEEFRAERPSRCLARGFHSQPVTCLAANPANTRVCSGSWDRSVKVWPVGPGVGSGDDATSGGNSEPPPLSPLASLEGHSDCVSSCAWSGQEKVLSCSWDHSISIWDVDTCQCIRTLSGNRAMLAVSENAHSGLIATGGSDNHIRVWNTSDEEPTLIRLVLRGHSGWVCSVAWSQETEHHLVSGSYDGSIKHWDTRNPKAPLYTVGAHKKKLLCLDWRDGERVVSGGEDGNLVVSQL